MTASIATPAPAAAPSRSLPWSDTAVILDGNLRRKYMKSDELIQRTGLDWVVGQHPLTANVHGVDVDIPGKRAMVREDDNTVLGVTSTSYEPFQNSEVFAFADTLVDEKEARYVAGGQLKGGRQVFAVMQLAEELMVGEEDRHDIFLFLKTAHDGTGAIAGYITPIRFFCTNVMTSAVRNATDKFSFRHTRDVREKMNEAHQTLGLTKNYAAAFKAQSEDLMSLKVDNDKAAEVFNLAIPHYIKEREARVLDMMAAYEGSSANGYQGTGWGVYNAVTEFYDHIRENRGKGEARIIATMSGGETAKIRERAMQALLSNA